MKNQDITYQDKLDELIQDLSHPNSKNVLFVLVEGDTDVRLFRKIFDSHCKVENIIGGSSKVESAVAELLGRHHLIIGIRDADFIHLNQSGYNNPNIFLTDFHDIEMMLIANDKLFYAILIEYFNDQMECDVTRSYIIESINFISLLKLLNDREMLEFKFEVGFVDLIDFESCNIDYEQYFNRLLSKSPSVKIKNLDDILSKLENLKQQNPNKFQLCNGHDFIDAFAEFLRKKGNNPSLKNNFLDSLFRIACTKEEFEKTMLYQDIKKWAKSKNIII
ncbi:MAG: DUF4435 domain-containing protein [Cytophagales bacterium]|nr:MAG: DUF4435 domain-containing protein [Cytophagales bacterium]